MNSTSLTLWVLAMSTGWNQKSKGGIAQYRYDNSDNRIQLKDASFKITRWQSDAQGLVLSEIDTNQRGHHNHRQ